MDMSQPARFWAFVHELESQGVRPSDNQAETEKPQGGARKGSGGRGMRGQGRSGRGGRGGLFGRRARMQAALAEMQANANSAPEFASSDEDGFTPITTPVESLNEKQVLFDAESTETENDAAQHNSTPHRAGGLGGRGGRGRRGRGGHGAGPRASMGMKQGFGGCCPGAFGPRVGPFHLGQMRKALNNNSGSDNERNAGRPGMKKSNLGANKSGSNKQQKQFGAKKPFKARADVFDSPNSYTVNFALPGAKKNNVKLTWRSRRGVLIVEGRTMRKSADLKDSHTLAQRERVAGVFKRRVPLTFPRPARIDADRIVAKLEDGVLRVDIPKAEKEKPSSGPISITIN